MPAAFLLILLLAGCHPEVIEIDEPAQDPQIPCPYQEELSFPNVWTFESYPITEEDWMKEISFPTEQIGYALGDRSAGGFAFVKKTMNGGVSWTDLQLPQSVIGHSISFYDEDQGLIALNDRAGCPSNCLNRCRVLKTEDGGQSWIQIEYNNLTGNLYEIQFISATTGYALLVLIQGGGFDSTTKLVKTTDGGTSWNVIYDDPNHPLATSGKGYEATGSDLYLIGEGGRILHLDADGNRLSTLETGNLQSYDVKFADAQTIYMTGTNGMSRSSDGGQTWEVQLSTSTEMIGFFGADEGLVLNRETVCPGDVFHVHDRLMVTEDGANTWHRSDFISNASFNFQYGEVLSSNRMVCLIGNTFVIAER